MHARMHMHACVWLCACIRVHACIYQNIRGIVRVHIHGCMHDACIHDMVAAMWICMCVDACIDMCTDAFVDECMDMCIDVPIEMIIDMCIDVCIYKHVLGMRVDRCTGVPAHVCIEVLGETCA